MGRPKALVVVANGCDTDCVFCRRNEIRRRAPSPPAARIDWARYEEFLALSRRVGIADLEIGGDEPTMIEEPALAEVLRRGRGAGFSAVRLVSNGVKLGALGTVEKLVGWGATHFCLPLYGAGAATHDAITRKSGSFDSVGKAVASAGRLGAGVLLHAVILKQNEHEEEEIRRLAASWGLPLALSPLQRRSHDPHVDYEALAPSGGRAGAALAAEPSLNYHLLQGEMIVSSEETASFIRLILAKSGMAAATSERLMRRLDQSPVFCEPALFRRLLEGLGRGSAEDPDMRLLTADSAARVLKIGSSRLSLGAAIEAVEAFQLVLKFKGDDAATNRAKEIARRILEDLTRKRRHIDRSQTACYPPKDGRGPAPKRHRRPD